MSDEKEPGTTGFEEHPGKTGAKRASFSEANPRAVIERIIAKHPEWNNGTTAGESLIISHFTMATEANEALLETVIGYCVTNTLAAINRDRRRTPTPGAYADGDKAAAAAAAMASSEPPPPPPRRSAEDIAAAKAIKEAAIQDIRQQMSLLSLIMPNGKTFFECTGTECGDFGGWFKLVKKRVGRRKVGHVMTEAMLRELQTWKD